MADTSLEAIFNEVVGDTKPNPLNSGPVKLRVGNKEYTASSPEEIQNLIDGTLTQADSYVQNLQAEIAARDAALEQLRMSQAQPTAPKTQSPNAVDPKEYLEKIVENPEKGLEMILEKHPDILDRHVANHPKIKELDARNAYQSFTNRHPLYQDPNILGGLTKIAQNFNLPVSDQSLELAMGYAVANGMLPHESVLRAQQQQAFVQRFGATTPPPQPQYDEFGNPLGGAYEPPPVKRNVAPPPQIGGSNGGGNLTTEQRIAQRFNYGNLTTEQMRQMILAQTNGRID